MSKKPDFGDMTGESESETTSSSSSSSSSGGGRRSAVRFQGEFGTERFPPNSSCEVCGGRGHGGIKSGRVFQSEVEGGKAVCREHLSERMVLQWNYGITPELELFRDY